MELVTEMVGWLAMTHVRLMMGTNLILAMGSDEGGTPFELTEDILDDLLVSESPTHVPV